MTKEQLDSLVAKALIGKRIHSVDNESLITSQNNFIDDIIVHVKVNDDNSYTLICSSSSLTINKDYKNLVLT